MGGSFQVAWLRCPGDVRAPSQNAWTGTKKRTTSTTPPPSPLCPGLFTAVAVVASLFPIFPPYSVNGESLELKPLNG